MSDCQHIYHRHLKETTQWLRRSIHKSGGSCAYYSPLLGWGPPYPETSGYIIPSLIDASSELPDDNLSLLAIQLGEWLLQLQDTEGWWPAGLLKSNKAPRVPSVFNTAQIIDGMVALSKTTGESRWALAGCRAARWLSDGVDEHGLWSIGNYKKRGENPSYYSRVAWPMLRAWQIGASYQVRDAAVRVLDRIVAQRNDVGGIAGWSFDSGKPAFTHTIAYTLRGLIESAEILNNWSKYGAACEKALEKLARKAEFTDGRLPAAYSERWKPTKWYTCLTGNLQIAICLLRYEQRESDLRLVNAAAKLVDRVCKNQRIDRGWVGTRGAVPGSAPLWGRYMFMRYPNWAAKYQLDALTLLIRRLRSEGLR